LSALRNRPTLLLLEYTLPMKLALAGRIPPNLKSTPISVVDAHFVVSKKTPDAAALLARLERSFQRLRSAGSLP
jgi:polar amino acid transport system substrate-binding protein